VFIIVHFVIDSVRKILDTPSYNDASLLLLEYYGILEVSDDKKPNPL
jgi:hypothetical protein